MPPPANLEQLLDTSTFPGMTARESRLVRSFLSKRGAAWDEASVTEKIGHGVMLPPTYSEKERADWERRTRARPDLVLRRAPNQVCIVEAKEQLTNEGVWQVLAYRDLWLADHPGDQVIVQVVAEQATPTALQLVRMQGVNVHLFTFDENRPLEPGTETPAP